MTQVRFKVKRRGPLFDGTARRALAAYTDETEEAIADQGVNDVRSALGVVLDNPTGYYESRIRTDRQSDDQVVTDGGVLYGPWLEGEGSRNKASRFKGYHTFRRTAQRLQGKAVKIAEQVLDPYLRRIQ